MENCSDPNPRNHILYEQPVWQTLQMFGELGPLSTSPVHHHLTRPPVLAGEMLCMSPFPPPVRLSSLLTSCSSSPTRRLLPRPALVLLMSHPLHPSSPGRLPNPLGHISKAFCLFFSHGSIQSANLLLPYISPTISLTPRMIRRRSLLPPMSKAFPTPALNLYRDGSISFFGSLQLVISRVQRSVPLPVLIFCRYSATLFSLSSLTDSLRVTLAHECWPSLHARLHLPDDPWCSRALRWNVQRLLP